MAIDANPARKSDLVKSILDDIELSLWVGTGEPGGVHCETIYAKFRCIKRLLNFDKIYPGQVPYVGCPSSVAEAAHLTCERCQNCYVLLPDESQFSLRRRWASIHHC